MVNEIEKSILFVIHNMHFTANQLVICNAFYNSLPSGITLDTLAMKIGKQSQGEIGGILSQMAQIIDKLENPGEKYGFTGYLLFFERFQGDLHKIRPEFRRVLDQHSELKKCMTLSVDQVYEQYKDGITLQ